MANLAWTYWALVAPEYFDRAMMLLGLASHAQERRA